MVHIPDTFLGLDGRAADYKSARFAVLPIPYDASTSWVTGTREGPRAIVSASQYVEFYDTELGRESFADGIATLDPLEPDARGPKEMHERIFEAARKVVRNGKFLIGLGGEHSVTSGLVRAVHGKHKKLSVLQVDAHTDLRDSYHGSEHSHACVMRRIHDMGIPAVAVGVRAYEAAEAQFIRKNKKPIFSGRECNTTNDWIERAVEPLTDEVYVTIDIDGFDPAYAPATGTPEPGGLNWFQVTDLLAAVAKTRKIVGMDVVEVRPMPPATATEFLAARLIYRVIGLVSGKRR